MVCDRCKAAVEASFEKEGLQLKTVDLGQVVLAEEKLSVEKYEAIKQQLQSLGFELLEDKRKVLVAQVKSAVVALVHYDKEPLKINLSDYLSAKLNIDYASLANIFSTEEKNTIEHYYIQQKIERAKELLSYRELTLGEIAFQLNYSSVAHLSAQFKKETGLTPTVFKKNTDRQTLDKL